MGAVLLVAAVAIGVTALVLTFRGFTAVDATVEPGTSATVVVSEGDADADRLAWGVRGQPPDCDVVDAATGEPVVQQAPRGTFTKDLGGRSWRGLYAFDPGSGRLEVGCARSGGPLQIGPAPGAGLLGGLVTGILVPLLLGGAGLVVLVVTGILFATRAPRPGPAGASSSQRPPTT